MQLWLHATFTESLQGLGAITLITCYGGRISVQPEGGKGRRDEEPAEEKSGKRPVKNTHNTEMVQRKQSFICITVEVKVNFNINHTYTLPILCGSKVEEKIKDK